MVSNFDIATYTRLLTEAKTECVFCNPDSKRVIAQTENFVVMAGLGPVRAGYTILFPRSHIDCCANIPSDLWQEFCILEDKVVRCLKNFDRYIVRYEHGKVGGCFASAEEDSKHCFHAHRVFVPWPRKFDPRLGIASPHIDMLNRVALRQISGHYIYVNDVVYPISEKIDLKSQFMRRYLLRELGKENEFCWAKHPKFDVVSETVERMRELWS